MAPTHGEDAMKQRQPASPEARSVALLLLGLLAGSATCVQACSFMLDTSVTQCQSDQDCARFGSTVCDVVHRVCVASRDAGADVGVPGVQQDGAAACVGPSGCFSCTPSNEAEILSECTDSVCVPFDNNRLTLFGPDGGLRPLP
jgi:hypothetical protein